MNDKEKETMVSDYWFKRAQCVEAERDDARDELRHLRTEVKRLGAELMAATNRIEALQHQLSEATDKWSTWRARADETLARNLGLVAKAEIAEAEMAHVKWVLRGAQKMVAFLTSCVRSGESLNAADEESLGKFWEASRAVPIIEFTFRG